MKKDNINKINKEFKKLKDINNKKYINCIMNKIKIIMSNFNIDNIDNILNNVNNLGELNIISYILFNVNLINDDLRINLRNKFCNNRNIKPYVFYNIYVRDICYKKFINKYKNLVNSIYSSKMKVS